MLKEEILGFILTIFLCMMLSCVLYKDTSTKVPVSEHTTAVYYCSQLLTESEMNELKKKFDSYPTNYPRVITTNTGTTMYRIGN